MLVQVIRREDRLLIIAAADAEKCLYALLGQCRVGRRRCNLNHPGGSINFATGLLCVISEER